MARPDPVAVTINEPNCDPRTEIFAGDPRRWTAEDAREFVWEVWRRLNAHVGESLAIRSLDVGRYRLEFVADSGAATTGPIELSAEAVTWLEAVAFRLPSPMPH